MDLKKATEIVVGMAQERSPDSPEGEALRMVLKELKEHRLFSNKAENIVESMLKSLDEDMQKIVDANENLVKELKDGKSSNRL
jgi:hypothetical protein